MSRLSWYDNNLLVVSITHTPKEFSTEPSSSRDPNVTIRPVQTASPAFDKVTNSENPGDPENSQLIPVHMHSSSEPSRGQDSVIGFKAPGTVEIEFDSTPRGFQVRYSRDRLPDTIISFKIPPQAKLSDLTTISDKTYQGKSLSKRYVGIMHVANPLRPKIYITHTQSRSDIRRCQDSS